jgi:hypothetical protein
MLYTLHTNPTIQIEITINYSKTLSTTEAEDIAINSLLEKTRKAIKNQAPELIDETDQDSDDPLEDVVDGILTYNSPNLEDLFTLDDPETQEAFLDQHFGEFFDHNKSESWTVYIS